LQQNTRVIERKVFRDEHGNLYSLTYTISSHEITHTRRDAGI